MFNITTTATQDGLIQTTDARELHEKLGIGRDFSSWIKPLLENFVEGYDFVAFDGAIPPNGGTARKEYALSINTAKHIALQAKSDIGRQIRQWYIDLETKPTQQTKITFADAAAGAKIIAEALNLSESSKLLTYGSVAKQYNVQLSLPVYAVDESTKTKNGSSDSAGAATAMLREHEIDITTAAFNKLLEKAGLLEQLSRKNSKGEIKKYWNVTTEGLEFGKNITNPANPRETQPLWYHEHFDALMYVLGL
jgi:phage anti-repressor protein